jgi:tRNA U55 pseudouridine synthase TruB
VRLWRGRRFDDLVRRQLDLFAEDEAVLLAEADEAERRYDEAPRDEAEEAYGDFQLVLDSVADVLGDVKTAYSGTLDEQAAEAYEAAFDRLAGRRFPLLRGRF